MWTESLTVLALLATGVAAGIMAEVVLAGIPVFAHMTPQRYVWTHQRLDRRYEPTMPLLVLGAMVASGVLAGTVGSATGRWLHGTAAVALLGTALVSQFAAVPLLRKQVRDVDSEALPADWRDPRPVWKRWHQLRTVLALVALAVTALAAVLRP